MEIIKKLLKNFLKFVKKLTISNFRYADGIDNNDNIVFPSHLKSSRSLGVERVVRLLQELSTFHATDLFSHPLKTSEDLWFSDVLRGYRERPDA